MTAIDDESVRQIIIGREVQTFGHGLKNTLVLCHCMLEANDVILCGKPKLRYFNNAPKIVVPFMLNETLLWVPTGEMGLSEGDFDWVVRKWQESLIGNINWHDVSQDELALFMKMGRHKSASLN